MSDSLTLENVKKGLDNYDLIALGPGLGKGQKQAELVSFVIKNSQLPVVLDADGINNLNLKELKNCQCELVMTPHPGEFARLVNKSITEIQENRIDNAREFAKKYKVNLVLKGVSSLIADKNGNIYINKTGNEGMATAGSGDVLTGIISSLIGQGLAPFKSAVLGVYLHGLAGDQAKSTIGSYSVIAGDIIENIPPAISKIKRGCNDDNC
jgi:NAD(P)H-hydrate epimerase